MKNVVFILFALALTLNVYAEENKVKFQLVGMEFREIDFGGEKVQELFGKFLFHNNTKSEIKIIQTNFGSTANYIYRLKFFRDGGKTWEVSGSSVKTNSEVFLTIKPDTVGYIYLSLNVYVDTFEMTKGKLSVVDMEGNEYESSEFYTRGIYYFSHDYWSNKNKLGEVKKNK